MFKQDFEWLTSNTRVAYPFVGQVDSPTGSSGTPFSDLVVDAYLTYKTDEEQDIRLHSLGDPSGASVDVEFRFADNSVAFSSVGADFKKSAMGIWTFLEWSKDGGAARLLLDTSKISEFTWPATPTDAYLVGHAVQPLQSFVDTLNAEGESYDGFIELLAGYNIKLEVRESLSLTPSVRKKTRVRISVDPGSGLGTYPDCTFDPPPVYTINGIGPDSQGNFIMNPQDCYRGQPPVTNPLVGPPWTFKKNTYKFFNNCSPCCDCEDYIYVYDYLLRRTYQKAKQVSDRFYTVRDQYKTLYQQILEQKACREKPRVDLKLVGRHGWCVVVQLVVYNNSGCQADSVVLNVTMSGPSGAAVPDAQRIDTDDIEHKPFALLGSWPNYTVGFTDGVRGARVLVSKFEIYFPIGARSAGAVVRGEVSGTVDGVAVSDTATTRLTQVFNKT